MWKRQFLNLKKEFGDKATVETYSKKVIQWQRTGTNLKGINQIWLRVVTCPDTSQKRNKKRSKTNINTEKVKYITPICPLGGKCIQPPGEDGYNPANCKKCSKMIEGLSW